MKKIEITETFGRYKKGQIVEMGDFDIGHALAFNYGKIHIEKTVEVQAVRQSETMVESYPGEKLEHEEKQSFLKRRGRRSKNHE